MTEQGGKRHWLRRISKRQLYVGYAISCVGMVCGVVIGIVTGSLIGYLAALIAYGAFMILLFEDWRRD